MVIKRFELGVFAGAEVMRFLVRGDVYVGMQWVKIE